MPARASLVVLGLLAAGCAQSAPARDHDEAEKAPVVVVYDSAAAKAAEDAAAKEKDAAKAKAKAGHGEGGSIEDRLARIEKLLVGLTEQSNARAAKEKAATGQRAKHKASAGQGKMPKPTPSAAAEKEVDALRWQVGEMKESMRRMELERNELKARVKELETELAAVREKLAGAK